MAPSLVHLPNGTTLTVSPSFGGLFFKSNDLSHHQQHHAFPPGWTIILHSEDDESDHPNPSSAAHTIQGNLLSECERAPRGEELGLKKHHIHRFRRPTLRNDHLFISSISNPSSTEFKPPTSPTRQIAMMLWATLWWYFHQPAPDPQVSSASSANTPHAGQPKAEWRININREGIFKGKHLLPKLERMGLIASDDSMVGADPEDGVSVRGSNENWTRCFISRKSFWQLDARIYLFTMAPQNTNSPYPAMSPATSRPSSPNRPPGLQMTARSTHDDREHRDATFQTLAAASNIIGGGGGSGGTGQNTPGGLWRSSTPPGPFQSGSHLPTFYPPPPLQYTFTNGVRHPIRPKPPRQGETFYTRYIPSLGQYLSFRVASMSPRPVMHRGPCATPPAARNSDPTIPTLRALTVEKDTTDMTDIDLLHKWMNNDRVSASWGEQGPKEHQADFLKNNLMSRNSFPAIGLFDSKPFGYFEVYWIKEDRLAAHLGGDCGDWDRGLHCLVGEEEFRGPHRVRVWLSALVHHCLLADLRTNTVMMEPRVDNVKLKQYCEEIGFFKEKEVTFPHKQSNLLKIRREGWDCPAL